MSLGKDVRRGRSPLKMRVGRRGGHTWFIDELRDTGTWNLEELRDPWRFAISLFISLVGVCLNI